MNTLLLHPTDVLFFRDGRPMGGASAGHGAAWPLPSVTNAALHAALWRSGLEGHRHDHHDGHAAPHTDARQFGSLLTAGPFPVGPDGRWYFPRPLDLGGESLQPTLRPAPLRGASSLPAPLTHLVVSLTAPTKDSAAKSWLSTAAYQQYLAPGTGTRTTRDAINDRDFSDVEATIGIGIAPDTQTQDGTNIYAARYLRLHEGWRIGVVASTSEKKGEGREDLIPRLISESRHIIIGGQQRVCSATRVNAGTSSLFPRGSSAFTPGADGKFRVKWILLSPAIFPAIAHDGTTHEGGWLPSWIRASDGTVQLRAESAPRRPGERRDDWRGRVQKAPMVKARLVAALVPKPIPVTGWSLAVGGSPSEPASAEAEIRTAGARATHLAVPAGAVYYFTCDTSDDARALAAALNWHGGDQTFTTIRNRRSTLLGEKGFGLGVCGTWQLHGEAGH